MFFFKFFLFIKTRKFINSRWIFISKLLKLKNFLKFIFFFFSVPDYIICNSSFKSRTLIKRFSRHHSRISFIKKHFKIIYMIKLARYKNKKNIKSQKRNTYKNFLKNFCYFFFINVKKNKFKENQYIIDPIFHGKDILWNDFCNLSFYQNINIYKNNFLSYIILLLSISVDSLWILDNQYEKFWKRKIHGNKIVLPPPFCTKFFGSKTYNFLFLKKNSNVVFSVKKKMLKECKLLEISYFIKTLTKEIKYFLINQNFLDEIISSMIVLANSFISYAEYNKNSSKRTKKNHLRTTIRNFEKYLNFKTIEPCQTKKKKNCIYQKFFFTLFKNLEKLKDYEPIEIFSFLPLNKYQRANILKKIQFPFPLEILEYSPGGNKRKIVICWKIPFSKEFRSQFKSNLIINREKAKFPVYLSRTMLHYYNQ